MISAKKIFLIEDTTEFAKISGDWNPIHTDVISARRLIAGEVVVHGILGLLWAIESYVDNHKQPISSIHCNFLNPITLGKEHTLKIEYEASNEAHLIIYSENKPCLRTMIEFQGVKNTEIPQRYVSKNVLPDKNLFNDLKQKKGTIHPNYQEEELKKILPKTLNNIGMTSLSSILCLSKLVGMRCPGMNSLFSSLKLSVKSLDSNIGINWHVSRFLNEIAPIKIDFDGCGVIGEIEAFFRPGIVNQKSIDLILGNVEPNKFKNQNALVIGGSRGLGEVVTKIIAAGGGKVLATYFNGKDDIDKMLSSFTKHKLNVQSTKLDINNLTDLNKIILNESISHIYYFASPRIIPNKSKDLDQTLLKNYQHYYVDQFRVLLKVLEKLSNIKFKVFYPSTIFIDENMNDFLEYIQSKKEGEELSCIIEKNCSNIKILKTRLPRMHTDQTVGITKLKTKDNLLVMLEIVQNMSDS